MSQHMQNNELRQQARRRQRGRQRSVAKDRAARGRRGSAAPRTRHEQQEQKKIQNSSGGKARARWLRIKKTLACSRKTGREKRIRARDTHERRKRAAVRVPIRDASSPSSGVPRCRRERGQTHAQKSKKRRSRRRTTGEQTPFKALARTDTEKSR